MNTSTWCLPIEPVGRNAFSALLFSGEPIQLDVNGSSARLSNSPVVEGESAIYDGPGGFFTSSLYRAAADSLDEDNNSWEKLLRVAQRHLSEKFDEPVQVSIDGRRATITDQHIEVIPR